MMNNRNLLRAAVAATLSVAVAHAAEYDKAALQAKAQEFAKDYAAEMCLDPSGCDVTVTVKEGCVVQRPVPYTLGMPTQFSDVPIRWKLDAASVALGAAFTSDGITFKTAGWQKEFVNKMPGAAVYQWLDKNKLPGSTLVKRPYAYAIKVKLGAKTCTYDPTVINDY
jgi:hypothetical protein